ncbi:MAG: DUF4375 domain-containing protein [Syntrophaceae bacterium]|nr:DUF4375 domain-containing protein [Syntrophaceae bacterium]
MTEPRKVSRKAYQEFKGERWNAMNHLLAMSRLEELTPIQRKAHLAYWYESEVRNGGHWQYFCNKAAHDQNEVIEALHEIGAKKQAEILTQALARLPEDIHRPETVEEFIAGYDEVEMTDLDFALDECSKKIMDYLEDYLDRYESEFIEWIP